MTARGALPAAGGRMVVTARGAPTENAARP